MTSISRQLWDSVPWGRWTDSAVNTVIDKAANKAINSKMKKVEAAEEQAGDEVDPIEQIKQSNVNIDESHLPALSVMLLITNLRKLNSRTRLLADVQYQVARFFSWNEPAFTLTVLSLHTYICIYPNLLVCVPIVGLLLGILIPGYDKRHPPRELGIEPTDKPRKPEFDEMSEFTPDLDPPPEYTKQDRDVMKTLRHLQNVLTNIVKALEDFDCFVYTTGSFVNEKDSSALFVILLGILPVAVYGASFVPVNVFIISVGWLAAIACHPMFQKHAKQFKEDYAEYFVANEKWLEELLSAFEKREIIIDEPPENRTVEIFELQRQGLTPRQWDPWVFTPTIYSENSPFRISQSRPPGTRFIDDVQPPEGWHFLPEYPWELDHNTKAWTQYRDIRKVEIDIEHHWAYDSDNGIHGEWRRRRWIRKCFRQAAEPFKQP